MVKVESGVPGQGAGTCECSPRHHLWGLSWHQSHLHLGLILAFILGPSLQNVLQKLLFCELQHHHLPSVALSPRCFQLTHVHACSVCGNTD